MIIDDGYRRDVLHHGGLYRDLHRHGDLLGDPNGDDRCGDDHGVDRGRDDVFLPTSYRYVRLLVGKSLSKAPRHT